MLAVLMEANPMGMKAYREQTQMEMFILSVPHELAISITKHLLRQK
jgi:hypothetical protein